MSVIIDGTAGVTASGGLYAQTTFTGSYSDGIVVDYTTGTGRISVGSSDGLSIYNGGVANTALLNLTSTGNLGLGVTPSAWGGSRLAFEMGSGSLIYPATNAVFQLAQNAYYGASGWTYKASTNASIYSQDTGKHIWYTAPSGTAGNAITFTQAMMLDASGNLGVGTSSPSSRMHIANAGDVSFRAQNTAASTVGLLGADVNGAYAGAFSNNAFVLYTNSTERARIDSSGNVLVGTTSPLFSSAGRGNITLNGTSDSILTFGIAGSSAGYIYSNSGFLEVNANGSRYITFYTNSTERARIDSSGNVLVGSTTTPTANFYGLYVKSTTSASTDWGFWVNNSSSNSAFRIRNDGYVNSVTTYSNTSASAANMYIDSQGYIYRSTSSLKYKTDVQDAVHGLDDLMKLRSVTYKQKTENATTDIPLTVFGGLIAEEVHEAGLTEFVQYAEDGTPDALAYSNMVSLCIKAIQEQQAIIEQLRADVEQLKGKA